MIIMCLTTLPIYCQILFTAVLGFRWGAPLSSCLDMRPQHGYTPLTEDCPFDIQLDYADDLSSYSYVKHTRRVVARLYSKTGDTFRGFMIMVQNKELKTFGRFLSSDNYQILDCFTQKRSCVTHYDSIPTTQVNITWIPPRKPVLKKHEVYFIVTFVKSMEESWVGVKSKPFRIRKVYLHRQHPTYESRSSNKIQNPPMGYLKNL